MQGQKFLVQILARLPNTFYRISQIFIDTSVFRYRMADSLGRSILTKLQNHQDSFEHLAQTYSMGGESVTKGDLGWVARGSIIPAIDKQLDKGQERRCIHGLVKQWASYYQTDGWPKTGQWSCPDDEGISIKNIKGPAHIPLIPGLLSNRQI